MSIFCKVAHTNIRCDETRSVCLTRKYLYCKFEFATNDWDDTEKTAVFRNKVYGTKKSVAIEGDMCQVPWECLEKEGVVEICVIGERPDGYVIRTTPAAFTLDKTITDDGEESAEPTPTLIEQVRASKVTLPVNEDGSFDKGTPGLFAVSDGKGGILWVESGAGGSEAAEEKVAEHNLSAEAHNDIRLLVAELATRLNALADSDDTTLDQLSEIVAYIKSNKSLIDAITTSKIGVSDIIDDLTTNVSNKPLSAAQGVALKAMIDALITDVYSKSEFDAIMGEYITDINTLVGGE